MSHLPGSLASRFAELHVATNGRARGGHFLQFCAFSCVHPLSQLSLSTSHPKREPDWLIAITIMTDAPFQYDDALLSSCAQSDVAASILSGDDDTNAAVAGDDDAAACRELFLQHASHYGRDIDIDEEQSGAGATTYRDRFRRFVSSVAFVHRHNNSSDEGDGDDCERLHRVTLNRFSDRYEHELPLMVDGSSDSFVPSFDSLPLLSMEHEYHEYEHGEQESNDDSNGHGGPIFSRLDYNSQDVVQSVSSTLGFGFGFLRPKVKTTYTTHSHRFVDEVTPLPGSSSSSHPVFIWSKKGQSSLYLERETDRNKHTYRKEKMDESDGTIDGREDSDFATSLDWSTTNNPDGVPIVHSVMDQGTW